MKKILSTLITSLVLFSLFTVPVSAVSASPNSGTYTPGSEQTIAILADPPNSGVTSVQLRLNLTGATIVDGTVSTSSAEDNGFLVIGVCSNGRKYSATEVCIDMAKTSGFVTDGELLVQMKIRFAQTGGSAVLSTGSENGYLVATTVTLDANRTLGTYTVTAASTPTTAPLPVTGIEDYPILVVIAGLATIFVGIGFFVWRDRSQKYTN